MSAPPRMGTRGRGSRPRREGHGDAGAAPRAAQGFPALRCGPLLPAVLDRATLISPPPVLIALTLNTVPSFSSWPMSRPSCWVARPQKPGVCQASGSLFPSWVPEVRVEDVVSPGQVAAVVNPASSALCYGEFERPFPSPGFWTSFAWARMCAASSLRYFSRS